MQEQTMIVMRHAESVFNERRVLNGDPAVPGGLTGRGKEQARRAHELLSLTPLDLCVTTDFQRTIETADIVLAGRDVPRLVVEQLNDPPAGHFELRPYAELDTWQAENGPDAPLPGTGHTVREGFEMIREGFRLLAGRLDDSMLAIIHGVAVAWVCKAVDREAMRGHAEPVFLPITAIRQMIEATGDDVLRFW